MHPLTETLERIANKAQETWEDEAFQQRLDTAKSRISELVRENPLGSVGLALLAGLIIGKITRRGE